MHDLMGCSCTLACFWPYRRATEIVKRFMYCLRDPVLHVLVDWKVPAHGMPDFL